MVNYQGSHELAPPLAILVVSTGLMDKSVNDIQFLFEQIETIHFHISYIVQDNNLMDNSGNIIIK